MKKMTAIATACMLFIPASVSITTSNTLKSSPAVGPALFTRGALEQAVAPHRLRRPAAAAALLSVRGVDTVRGQASLLVTCHDHST
jgi:hypothetical protein